MFLAPVSISFVFFIVTCKTIYICSCVYKFTSINLINYKPKITLTIKINLFNKMDMYHLILKWIEYTLLTYTLVILSTRFSKIYIFIFIQVKVLTSTSLTFKSIEIVIGSSNVKPFLMYFKINATLEGT